MKVAIVGGNGFLGSAITKAAVGRGWEVSSISQSGRPFRTPSGHTPKWTDEVKWTSANVFDQNTYADVIKQSDAVVHTIGILLESDYKNGPLDALKGLIAGRENPNPLTGGLYERLNRDAAIRVADVYKNTRTTQEDNPFVYISAADIFRPLIPSRYISTKREAEEYLKRLDGIRDISLRPGLMYHPHTRPISTIPATMIDILNKLPKPFINGLDADSNLQSVQNLLHTSALHIDTVGAAALEAILDKSQSGDVNVDDIKRLAWKS
ncbi:hypothetical protein E3Q18_03641 [Wallemia mellicola]|uniref:NAD-dependent epimerase/dehydratase domain-containing protein n=2 Tax=Wallemia mellicola TaxID=1708541 RepID=A0A4T0NF78_9BASI|nr:hypothetical protein E3Q24_03516 [Wallemia mellicola]TIB72188.1 hypothetical protein E3Q23_03497 [Wallemia mellicola]TIB87756.1 hypothetical protein E3Q19_03529 [Wallemia mellicola]TIB95573.1 hypothetical protein E3Q18_03641 [Wallemia mellicola]TIC01940.1 hypothetical protein E3Q16_03641 [Wallemia mellicola]